MLLTGCYRQSLPQPPPEPVQAAAPTPHADVARGAYVALIAGCKTCHTEPGTGMDYAGGTEITTLDGSIVRMPNITQDRQTGIGAWSDAQIVAAMRLGIRPDGQPLIPAMPYPYFHAMTDADAASLVAFLRTVPAVSNQVARSEAPNMQPVELDAIGHNIDPRDAMGHGEYLAALMHCGACHTPQQGRFADEPFVGGVAFAGPAGSTVLSSNITSDVDTGLGKWTEDDIITALRDMRTPAGTPIRAPMAYYKDAWSKLLDDDAHAIGLFVKAIPPVHHDISVEEQQPALSQQP
jgi:mono/diheme cytochrome c family protein